MSHSAMIKDLTFGTAFKIFFGSMLFVGLTKFLDFAQDDALLSPILNGFFFVMLGIGAVMATIAIVKHIFNNFFRIVATISGMVAVWYIVDYIN